MKRLLPDRWTVATLSVFLLSGTVASAGTVTTTADSGPGSLRHAIADAVSGDAINFSLPPQSTIQLTTAQLLIDKSLIIAGPGASQLTVAGNRTSTSFRVFAVGTGNLDVKISGLTITNGGGFFVQSGGGISNESSGSVEVNSCVIRGNLTGSAGAGISNSGNLKIDSCEISANQVGGFENSWYGGGIINSGSLTVINSTISGNSVRSTHSSLHNERGGGIYNTGTLSIVNSTISGNDAAEGAGGGAALFGGSSVLTNLTVTDNRPGGVWTTAVLDIRNSIFAKNRPVFTGATVPDIAGSVTSRGYNLIGTGSAATITAAPGDQIGTDANPIDPVLGPLQSNGGATLTHALLIGSPAIDKGIASGGVATDQRGVGFSRTFDDPGYPNAQGGDGTDIGAFEGQTILPTPTPTPTPPATPTPTLTATPTPQPGSLANISTRTRVETGDNVLIGGFIVAGNQTKKVLIRAIGPSLPIPGRLENPTLELFGPAGFIEANDDWVNSPKKQEIMDTGIAPNNDFESAILVELAAGNNGYTASVRGVDNGSGIGLVEVYDLANSSVDSKLANISSRGFVQTGDNVMIAGVIVQGQDDAHVIVRAIGPSLTLNGTLANPTLELRDQNGGLLQANDDWRSGQEAEIAATNLAPSNDLESAILRRLPPANYTAIVRGVGNGTGIGLVEVYRLP